MKKIALVFALFTFALSNAQAPLEEGGLQLNLGVGTSGWGTPVYAGLDYGIARNFTLGGELSYQSYNTSGYKNSILGIQANGNYHFNEILNIPSEWDLYGGASLSYYNWSSKFDGESVDYSGADDIGIGLQVGGRYFFTDKLAINLQLGGSSALSGGKLGITLKL
ncbi:outer membrane beta-barrel protein [Flavobacterium algicola]|uniref:outer membrane beta-barrel protein n=1 Tax=Flavobacterium algicola TaxID=556529 RepID=UPI001EFDBD84|nr:outer membrane beta-barrel protein [Flavobacterium algicola]MCG9794167.1 porin family protein [Flavobacterium algicola]